jgi:thermitase
VRVRHSLTIAAALALLVPASAAGSEPLFPRKDRVRATAAAAGAVRYVPNELLVTYRRGAEHRRWRLAALVGGRELAWNARLRVQLLEVPITAAARLRRSPSVAHVERNVLRRHGHVSCVANPVCRLPNDPDFARQWWLQNDAATVQPENRLPVFGADIAAPLAWRLASGSSDVRVAVVDTGIDRTHPDVGARVVRSLTWTGNSLTDFIGHGTAIAGVIAAIPDNAVGGAGTAFNASLINVKVQRDGDDEGVSCADAAEGITSAVDAEANIINVSFGSPGSCAAERAAVDYAASRGVLVIAAAGNDGASVPNFPAAFSNVVSVAATDNGDRRASFSSFGSSWVDVAAPGVRLWTTLPVAGSEIGAAYGYVDGTSFAAPVVAGIAALIWSSVPDENNDGRRNDDVAARLTRTAEPILGTGSFWHFGRVNACLAASGGAASCPPPPPAPPVPPPAPAPAPPPVPTATPAPALPTMTLATGRRYVRRALTDLLRSEYRRRRGEIQRCYRSPPAGIRCTVSFRTKRYVYWGEATVRYAHEGGRLVWRRQVDVRRASRSCADRRGRARCPSRRFTARPAK